MTEEEFSKLPLVDKWTHVAAVMDYILKMEQNYTLTSTGYNMRRRLNPHHSKEDVAKEDKAVKEQQRNLRTDQYQRWSHIKGLYAVHRDEMVDTLDNSRFAEYKNILENVFTLEFDDALRDVIEE